MTTTSSRDQRQAARPATAVAPRAEVAMIEALRRTVLGVVVAVFGSVAVLCALVALGDFSSHDDEWDGLGGYVALLIGAPCLAVALGAGGCLLLTRRHPVVARALSGLLGAVMLAAAVSLLSGTGWAVVPILLGTLLVLVSAVPGGRGRSLK